MIASATGHGLLADNALVIVPTRLVQLPIQRRSRLVLRNSVGWESALASGSKKKVSWEPSAAALSMCILHSSNA